MATHSSTLAWKISWTEEPGGLHSMGSELDTTKATEHARWTRAGDRKLPKRDGAWVFISLGTDPLAQLRAAPRVRWREVMTSQAAHLGAGMAVGSRL